MPKKPLLSICIVSYNTAGLTVNAIKSIQLDVAQSSLLASAVEIIVVDNNSSDDSVKQLNALKAQIKIPIRVIASRSNRGFAGANNYAIKQSKGQFILLLNSDTYVQIGTLEKLVSTLQNTATTSTATLSSRKSIIDRLGILAATLVNPDGTLQPQGGSAPSLFALTNHLFLFDDLPVIGKLLPSTQHTGWSAHWPNNADHLTKIDWVAGTAMMLKRAVINEIGYLDENIFMYGEDVEYCLRANHHHWDVAIHTQAYITHLQTASSSQLNAVVGEMNGYLYIWAKHKPTWQLKFAKAIIKAGIWLRILIFGTIGSREKYQLYRKALSQIK